MLVHASMMPGPEPYVALLNAIIACANVRVLRNVSSRCVWRRMQQALACSPCYMACSCLAPTVPWLATLLLQIVIFQLLKYRQ